MTQSKAALKLFIGKILYLYNTIPGLQGQLWTPDLFFFLTQKADLAVRFSYHEEVVEISSYGFLSLKNYFKLISFKNT